MARSVKISKKFRIIMSSVLLLSWTSGILFFCMNRWLVVDGDFGPEKHPWQFGVLKTHGAGAFLMMITFGYLYATHVSVGWPVKKMRVWGLAVVLAILFLITTAYGLYYLGNEDIRLVVSYGHFAVGVGLPFLVLGHVIHGRRHRGQRGGAKKPGRIRVVKPEPEVRRAFASRSVS